MLWLRIWGHTTIGKDLFGAWIVSGGFDSWLCFAFRFNWTLDRSVWVSSDLGSRFQGILVCIPRYIYWCNIVTLTQWECERRTVDGSLSHGFGQALMLVKLVYIHRENLNSFLFFKLWCLGFRLQQRHVYNLILKTKLPLNPIYNQVNPNTRSGLNRNTRYTWTWQFKKGQLLSFVKP